VPKTEHASRDFYDVWLPNLAPSENLVKQGLYCESEDRCHRSVLRALLREQGADVA
jgi:uncharacterized protein YeaO (DUF488 family)